MLTLLRIENLALVDEIDIALTPGLNILTGETGAGKSVLVNALSLVLGGRASADAIRNGADEAVVEAMFEFAEGDPQRSRLSAHGIDAQDGEILVRRVVSRAGKGRVAINGQLVTVGMLQSRLRGVLDITGQHEHVSLLDADGHIDLVDAYGGLSELRGRVMSAHAEVVGYRAALEALEMDESEREKREDYLRFQLDEIAKVDPKQGEVEGLESERLRLKHAAELRDGVRRAEGTLYSDDGAVVEAVGRVFGELDRLASMDGRLRSLSTTLSGVLAELEDTARELSKYSSLIDGEPTRLPEIEDRLDALRRLTRKHGGSIDLVLAARSAMSEELDHLEHDEARRADLTLLRDTHLAILSELAQKLSVERGRAVESLSRAVTAELAELSMKNTAFSIALLPQAEPGARGAETAEIMISANLGEPMRPLRKIASGGELSRVLLALKHVIANRSAAATYVFDEVDAGIGGAVADILGRKLREVARPQQVICVTHLPQVAAHADAHFKVEKREEHGRTVTVVHRIPTEAAVVEELARMLGGSEITERTRGLAREMRQVARAPEKPGPSRKKPGPQKFSHPIY